MQGKRIFISDLPETVTQSELGKVFKDYGTVISTEIKERKELGPKNLSLFFAYVNIQIDDKRLHQCFQDFANEKWHGQYVKLQLARESFLERLKREREESAIPNKVEVIDNDVSESSITKKVVNGMKKRVIKCSTSNTSKISNEDDSSDSELDKKSTLSSNIPNETKGVKNNTSLSSTINKAENQYVKYESDENLDLIIKSNKGKVHDKNGLKIESVGKLPILKIDKSKKKADLNTSEANLKRLQSLINLKKGYKNQKSLIQAALSKVDNKQSNKIIFDEVNNPSQTNKQKLENSAKTSNLIFGDDDFEEDDGFETNFEVKKQFQGSKGQKLLELQSKYKSDKRFALDARFLDDEDNKPDRTIDISEDHDALSLEEEKKKEFEILEQVLGKRVTSQRKELDIHTNKKKSMVRFDPSQPEHAKYELKKDVKEKKKRKRKDSDVEVFSEKKQEEKNAPEVSKEIFYKVTEDLKESLQAPQEFSLLSMFGKAKDEDERKTEPLDESKDISKNKFANEKNPFRYDSSEDEEENVDATNKKDVETREGAEGSQTHRKSFWAEPFFFQDDDYRLQEGFDFIEKMRCEEKIEFTKLRRNLKEIVKAKVRNNQSKHKPFRKKLGGNKRKKMIKMKKALKR